MIGIAVTDMSHELQPIDIEHVLTTNGLIEEVSRGDRPRLLRRGDQDLALISPVKPSAKRTR